MYSSMRTLLFKPYLHSTITIGAVALANLLSKLKVKRRGIHALDIVIIATS